MPHRHITAFRGRWKVLPLPSRVLLHSTSVVPPAQVYHREADHLSVFVVAPRILRRELRSLPDVAPDVVGRASAPAPLAAVEQRTTLRFYFFLLLQAITILKQMVSGKPRQAVQRQEAVGTTSDSL
jgi:hypothetical protein